MSQMFYFEDPRVKENWRIFSDKLYKKLVDDHSKKADDFAAIFEVEKFCDGILWIYGNGNSMGLFMVLRYLNHYQHFWNGY